MGQQKGASEMVLSITAIVLLTVLAILLVMIGLGIFVGKNL
jgi:hypothetical protein